MRSINVFLLPLMIGLFSCKPIEKKMETPVVEIQDDSSGCEYVLAQWTFNKELFEGIWGLQVWSMSINSLKMRLIIWSTSKVWHLRPNPGGSRTHY